MYNSVDIPNTKGNLGKIDLSYSYQKPDPSWFNFPVGGYNN